ncbi:MAG: efflux RND transporter periplasmic adaptor subunit [Candidatus Binataceae bacterium]
MSSPLIRRIAYAIAALLMLAAIIPAYRYYRYYMTHVSTDDAYVDGTLALVSARVAGTANAVYVDDNWTVRESDLLVTLDPRDFEVRVAQAQAQLDHARQTVDEQYAQLASAQAGLQLAESQLKQALADYERAKELKAQGVASGQFYDQAETAYHMALANRALAQHQVAQARAALGSKINSDHARYGTPLVEQAEATLRAAVLDLNYTRITAAFGGIIARKAIHVGQRVQQGQPLMAIIPINRLYVTANFKETQLTDVRVGQKAEIEADLYPGVVFAGHVESISIGTGSVFSLLPPENATGNWVKVVQRVPVKIVLDDNQQSAHPLRMGLSVVVSVDISDQSGPLLSSERQMGVQQQGGEPIPRERLKIDSPNHDAPVAPSQK